MRALLLLCLAAPTTQFVAPRSRSRSVAPAQQSSATSRLYAKRSILDLKPSKKKKKIKKQPRLPTPFVAARD